MTMQHILFIRETDRSQTFTSEALIELLTKLNIASVHAEPGVLTGVSKEGVMIGRVIGEIERAGATQSYEGNIHIKKYLESVVTEAIREREDQIGILLKIYPETQGELIEHVEGVAVTLSRTDLSCFSSGTEYQEKILESARINKEKEVFMVFTEVEKIELRSLGMSKEQIAEAIEGPEDFNQVKYEAEIEAAANAPERRSNL
ncbi:hypothetical protein LCGC14_2836970 [marine sediment metagenome]|uniref:Uncharacterized protein n=1 Tax=marine sediment metagenome TaxID=412755 RepID=A0A0F8YCJ1_9ZZZZ